MCVFPFYFQYISLRLTLKIHRKCRGNTYEMHRKYIHLVCMYSLCIFDAFPMYSTCVFPSYFQYISLRLTLNIHRKCRGNMQEMHRKYINLVYVCISYVFPIHFLCIVYVCIYNVFSMYSYMFPIKYMNLVYVCISHVFPIHFTLKIHRKCI